MAHSMSIVWGNPPVLYLDGHSGAFSSGDPTHIPAPWPGEKGIMLCWDYWNGGADWTTFLIGYYAGTKWYIEKTSYASGGSAIWSMWMDSNYTLGFTTPLNTYRNYITL